MAEEATTLKIKKSDQEILAKNWLEIIERGVKHRKKFKDQYEVAKQFAYTNHEFMYEETMPEAEFKATVPKVWEMISIFAPMMAFRNPHRNVKVRYQQEDDERLPFAKVLQEILNYHVNELDLNRQAREWVDEAMIGCGTMWLEYDEKRECYGHFHDSCINLVIDPDAEVLEDAWWIARKKQMPVWEFADLVGVSWDDEDLPSPGRPSITDSREQVERQGDKGKLDSGRTNELVTVWEVWSKMGIGWRARGITDGFDDRKDDEDNIHFYVAATAGRIWKPGEWPIPLWADNEWPVEMLFFRKDRNYVWPIPQLQPALGLQKAINWIVTFALTKLRTTSRDFIIIGEMDETLREKIISGMDLEVLEAMGPDDEDFRKKIGFLQHPPMNSDLRGYLEIVLQLFADVTGLYPALYAQSGQAEARSATASQSREARADLRPDDMRAVVEAAHSRMARKEAIAARLEYDVEFVSSILGPEKGKIWGEYQRGDLRSITREVDYTIEAGSAAKPNIESDREISREMFDRLTQLALKIGDIKALNKLSTMLQKAHGVMDGELVTFEPPQPPEQEQEQEPRVADTAESEEAEAAARAEIAQAKARGEALKVDLEERVGEGPAVIPAQPGEIMSIEDGVPMMAP